MHAASRDTNAAAPERRWLKLGLTALLGFAAGALLFPSEAKGRRGGGRSSVPKPRR